MQWMSVLFDPDPSARGRSELYRQLQSGNFPIEMTVPDDYCRWFNDYISLMKLF